MNRKALTTAAVAAIASLGIVACGGSSNSTTTSTTTGMSQGSGETIPAVAAGKADLSTLVAALKAGDLVSTLEGAGPFTVFAPTNAAFADIQSTVDTLLKPENKTQLQNVLKYHVVPGTYMAADLKDGQELTTVQGDKLKVSVMGGKVEVNGAAVVAADVSASNGVVHVIDAVLVPESK